VKILGIETSCDETAASVVEDGTKESYYGAGLDRRQYYYPERYPEEWIRPEDDLVMAHDVLNALLSNGDVATNDKMILEGFSSGGMFAQRFALAYPEKVKAIAAGQCGGVIALPITEHEGKELSWPIGISDYEEIFHKPFNVDAYKKIKQLIYIADGDSHSSTLPNCGPQFYVKSDINHIIKHFGRTDPERLENNVKYLNSIGFDNVEFYTYSGDGHVDLWNIGMSEVVIDFFDTYR